MKKYTLFLLVLFSSVLLAVDDSVSATEIFKNKSVEVLLSIGYTFLVIFFIGSLVHNLIKNSFGEGSVRKSVKIVLAFAGLFMIFNYSLDVVETFSSMVRVEEAENRDSIVSMADLYLKFDNSLTSLVTTRAESNKNAIKSLTNNLLPDLMTSGLGSLTSILHPTFIIGFILSLTLKAFLLLTLLSKFIFINMGWPILFQLSMLGIIYAVPLAALNGYGVFVQFGLTVVEVAQYPFYYHLASDIVSSAMVGSFNKFVTAATATDKPLSDIVSTLFGDIVLLAEILGFLVIIIALPLVVVVIARGVIRNEATTGAINSMTDKLNNLASI